MKDDATLLRCYARDRSENDFAALVQRHLNLVYSAALRQVNGDAHLAQDVTQLVFTDLARKAASVAEHRVLAGWLFTSTRFAAAKLVRGERRRQAREQEALLMQEFSSLGSAASLDWDRVRSVLDEALGELDEADREAILLRFMEGREYAEVGARLSLSANSARMRVDRAVDKLRALLGRRGVNSTAAALSMALAQQAVVAAPAGLATTVTSTALAGVALGSGTAVTLTFMSLTKLQLGLAGSVLLAGAGFYAVQEQANAALRRELAHGQPPGDQSEVAGLRETNRQLARAAAEAVALRVDDAELLRLRAQAAAVQDRLESKTLAASQAPAPRPKAATFDIGQVDQKPTLRGPVPPVYPTTMAQAGIEGNVVVEFLINADGRVADARVVQSSRPEFEPATLAAVSQWRFDAGQVAGQLVNTRARQSFEYSLQGGPPSPPPDWF